MLNRAHQNLWKFQGLLVRPSQGWLNQIKPKIFSAPEWLASTLKNLRQVHKPSAPNALLIPLPSFITCTTRRDSSKFEPKLFMPTANRRFVTSAEKVVGHSPWAL